MNTTASSISTITDGFTRRKKLFAILLLFLLPAFIYSQQSYTVTPDVIYGHKAGMALTYDVFRPDSANGAGLIHVVSGGWNSRYNPPDSVINDYRPYLDAGFTIFALRHGSSPPFQLPETVDDVILGSWQIRKDAHKFDVDSLRLGIFGGSSGGQLALMAGLSGERHPVSAIVAFFPPVDMRNIPDFMKAMFPAFNFDTTRAASISPILFASPDDPPTLLIHGDNDYIVSVKQSERMEAALEENGVVSHLIIYKGMSHGNSFGAKGKYYKECTDETVNWFKKYLTGTDKPD